MAKSQEIKEILLSAFSLSLIEAREKPAPCLSDYLNRANFLLFLLAKERGKGMSTAKLSQRSGLHINTVRVYLRSLVELGYVKRTAIGREAVWSVNSRG